MSSAFFVDLSVSSIEIAASPKLSLQELRQVNTQPELFDDGWPGFDEPYITYDWQSGRIEHASPHLSTLPSLATTLALNCLQHNGFHRQGEK